MANENGLRFILQHLQILLENNSMNLNENKIDQDDLQYHLTINDNSMNIPLSKSMIKSLIDCIHKDEQIYLDKKHFIDRFVNGNSVLPPPLPTTTTTVRIMTNTTTAA